MSTLILMHVESEGPGTLGEFLERTGRPWQTVRLHDGEQLPDELAGLDAVVSMGGPMNVYEEEKFPFLAAETAFLRRAIERDVPVLGICLGAQMIAKACGARVVRSPQGEELGWRQVRRTPEGMRDDTFDGFPESFEVFQWHGDMFEVPDGGTLLAASDGCSHQAFRCRRAVGLQFHLEVTDDLLASWFPGRPELESFLGRHLEIRGTLDRNAERLYRNFF
jgi:GMP synthase-like glutamine amidotransferase